ncbi:MAG: DUF2254 domain-containing protein [Armatimonadota bacterium]
MKLQLARLIEDVKTSLWFVPTVFVVLACGLAFGMMHVDRVMEGRWLRDTPWIFGAGTDGAREVLSAIASTMITVVGLTYSVTVVALVLAAQQYTPRVLRQFTSDRGNQVVLGGFIATFVYSLLVLRSVSSEENGGFVPHISVTVGVALALMSIGMLIYFIHHLTTTIRPSCIVGTVAKETIGLIDRLLDGHRGDDPEAAQLPAPNEWSEAVAVGAPADGYVQGIDFARLQKLARAHGFAWRAEVKVGDFVTRDAPMLRIWPAERLREAREQRLQRHVLVGTERTMHQDPDFGVLVIVDIAVKALSPGINDPTTAAICIDYLSAIHCRYLERLQAVEDVRVAAGRRRIVNLPGFDELVRRSYDPIRRHARGEVAIYHRLLEALERIARVSRAPAYRDAVRQQVDSIQAAAVDVTSADRDDIERACWRVLAALSPTLVRTEPHAGAGVGAPGPSASGTGRRDRQTNLPRGTHPV